MKVMKSGGNHVMTLFPVKEFEAIETPFYYYDESLLSQTLAALRNACGREDYKPHYAIKANADEHLLKTIAAQGLGADCVSIWEIELAVKAGFKPQSIVFAGVGKKDHEIRRALELGIGCFNVESEPELLVISDIAKEMGKTARVAIRVNPNIDAHTHEYITTGKEDNKFGIAKERLTQALSLARDSENVELIGLHFHIGSQLTDYKPFEMLCETINSLLDEYEEKGFQFKTINVGGGLGIDYEHPDEHPIPDFAGYFDVFKRHLNLRKGQELHFELGRAIVAQCGSLICRVLFIKDTDHKKFAILDGGMSDLIRPALYGAHHKIDNLTSPTAPLETYDVVGPICESADTFGTDERIPELHRGSLVALRSAGAYGQIMASHYNCRPMPPSVISSIIITT